MPYFENLSASQNTCCVWTSRPGHPSISFSLSEVSSHWQEGKLTTLDPFPHHHSQFILGDPDVLPGQVRHRVLGLIQVLLSVVGKPPEGWGLLHLTWNSSFSPWSWDQTVWRMLVSAMLSFWSLPWWSHVNRWWLDNPLIKGFVVYFWSWANSGGVNTQWKHARASE